MDKKKLLGILPSYSAGGAEKVMLVYFRSFNKRPLFLKLLVVNRIGPFKTKIVNSVEWQFKRFFYALPKIILYINLYYIKWI